MSEWKNVDKTLEEFKEIMSDMLKCILRGLKWLGIWKTQSPI
jgi:hypothetical protein